MQEAYSGISTNGLSRNPCYIFEDIEKKILTSYGHFSTIRSILSISLYGVHQYQKLIDLELLKMGAFIAEEMTPHLWAASVKMPVLMIQVLEDEWTRNPKDAQKIFDLLRSQDKELFWIEHTKKRFKDGYNHFGRYPERVLSFFEKHMR